MKILVVAGSSGGHIFPAVGLIETLLEKDKGLDVLLVLPQKNITEKIHICGYRICCIQASSFKAGLGLGNIANALKLLKGFWQSFIIIRTFEPDRVIAFGSITSIPIVILASFFKIKVWLHEQNVLPGRANRFLARFAGKIAISFRQTQDYWQGHKDKFIFTGNPLRSGLVPVDKDKALDFFGFSPGKFTVLVAGGSQGSQRINRAFLKAVSALGDNAGLQVIHISGKNDAYLLKRTYQNLNIPFRIFDFLESMHYAYCASDLIISRSGAGTVTEITYFKVPAIVVPYPFAYQHQAANARVLEESGCAVLIEDAELDTGRLKEALEDLILNRAKIEMMRSRYGGFKDVPARAVFAQNILSLN